jgi:putative oxidoreductase
MLKNLFKTENDWVIMILRILFGIVYFPHGMQKLFGWYGGPGYEGAMHMFTTNLGIPAPFAFLAIMAEGLGSLGLITGFFTRVAAFGIAVDMIVAVIMLHWQNGFFMNWFGKQKGEGFEFHILAVAIAIALIIRGGGKWSIDRAVSEKMR